MADPTTENPRLTPFQLLQRYFITGLFLLLPLIISIWILAWLYTTISQPTVQLLQQRYPELAERDYAVAVSIGAFVVNIGIVLGVGAFTRHVVGRRAFHFFETLLAQVPIFNKVYAGTKQIIEGFSPDKKSVFQQVVMVEFPKAGSYAIGLVTCETQEELAKDLGGPAVNIFIPTTPNPTSGFLLVVRRDQVRKLDMTVADAIKLVISGGTVMPERGQPV